MTLTLTAPPPDAANPAQWRTALRRLAEAAIDALDALGPDPDAEPEHDREPEPEALQ